MNIREKVYNYQTRYDGYFTIEEESHFISWFKVDMRNYENCIGRHREKYLPKYAGGDVLRPKEAVYLALRTSIELDGTVNN